MTMSTLPCSSSASTAWVSSRGAEARQRLDAHRPVGEAVAEVGRCCCARSVVGASTATCLPACTATKAARIATSVLPKPTSPQTMRSIGRSLRQVREHVADGLAPGPRSPRTGRRWRSSGTRARSSGSDRPRLRLAARIQVEQFRRHVADLLGGAPARPRPLVGAELVQRRALGRGAGVAADEVQLLHRHVDAVAVLVLEHQELPGLAADLHRHESLVAPDAVFLVHHRRAGVQAREVAQDRLRVGAARLRRRSWRARAPNSCASEMMRDRRAGERAAPPDPAPP